MAAADLSAGALLGGYEIQVLLARGGMGVVYRATQLSLSRQVALKVVAPDLSSEEEFRTRFLREVRIAASLDHPHVLPVYEAGEAGGVLYLAMRLVEGESLSQVLEREGTLEPARALTIVTQAAEALEAAHQAGLVHRDVKPANVLLARAGAREHVYLCDFGVARRSQSATALTKTGGFVGSITYAAPEQISGAPIDARTDTYALGCLLYECLTGAPPFPKEHEAAVLWAHLNEPPPLPSDTRPELGDAFDGIVERALAKDPSERFQTAAELAAALAADAPPAPRRLSATPVPTNLPTPASSFLGRERELEEVGALLARKAVRLLTLTGPGGTGKTRLALQAVANTAELFPDGTFWVPLAPLRDPMLVLSAVAQAMGVHEEPQRPLAHTLSSSLAERQALLLLDNVEHLLPEAANELEPLVSAVGGTLLVTSRERLQIQGEQLYAVPTLQDDDAVELFVARARALEPDFEANGVIGELCSRLDNLPLALELAAARTTIFSPEQLLERMSERLDLLRAGRGVDPRQQTIRATIEWSHDLLEPAEQQLFRSLSVFAGGCTYEAAEAVAGAEPDVLQSLLDKSLVRRRTTGHGPRFWMLETIREFAAERLEDAGEADACRQRHAEWMLGLADQAESGMEGPESRGWLSRLEQEQDNLRAAIAFTQESGQTGLQLDLVGRVWEFWDNAGTYIEGRRWAEAALSRSDPERSARRAKALRTASVCAGRLGDVAKSKAYAEESLLIFRELGDAKHIAWALNVSGVALAVYGDDDLEEVERLYEQARVLALETGETRIAAFATTNLGDLFLRRGDYARATSLTEEALALYSELGLVRERAWALHNLALLLLRSGREHEALAAARESLMLSGDLLYRTLTLALLGSLAARRADSEAGAKVLGGAAAAWERMSLAPTGVEAELYHETVEELRATLGQDRYDSAFAEGQTMAFEEAVEYALRTLE